MKHYTTDFIDQMWSNSMCHVSTELYPIGSDEWVFGYVVQWLPPENWDDKRRANSFQRIASFSEGPGMYAGGYYTPAEAFHEGVKKALEIILKDADNETTNAG